MHPWVHPWWKPCLIFIAFCLSLIQIIPDDVKMEYEMKGWVNGYEFTIEGEGYGKPYE